MKIIFPNTFAPKPGFFMQNFLHVMFKHINIDKEFSDQLKNMAKKGVIIYVTKYQSYFDIILYHYCLRKARLPYPVIGFDINLSLYLPVNRLAGIIKSHIGYFIKNKKLPSPYNTGFYKEAIFNKVTGIVSLINPKKFSDYFIENKKEPFGYILEIQKELDFPIFLVPITILYRNRPEREVSGISKILFSYRDKEPLFSKIAIFFKQHRKAFIDIGNPLNLQEYIMQEDNNAQLLRQKLTDAIDKQRRVVLGPVIKSKEHIKEMVLRDHRIDSTIKDIARGNKKRVKELRKKAEEYFEEIASDYSITYVTVFYFFLKWLWKKSFTGIDVLESELSRIRQCARKGYPIVYVPSHKSHVDYLVLNYILFEYNLHPPRIAAGKNLLFWPVGHIFRKCGAFFVRRSFGGARLYTLVFAQYIKILLQEGYPIEFFIEGGRSRSGKLEFPKTGLLSILINAWKEGYCKDIIFIPVSINYDRVVEENSYVKEMKGIEKVPESFKQVVKARNTLKKRYGKIYVRFSSYISLKEYMNNKDSSQEKLSLDIVRAINKVSVVTPVSLVSIGIMTRHRIGFYLYELISTCNIILDFLKNCNASVASNIQDNMDAIVEQVINLFSEEKILLTRSEQQHLRESFYYLNEKKIFELSYYKNNIIHYFVPYSFIAISFLACSEETISFSALKEDYLLLSNIFKYEFVCNSAEEEIEEILTYFYNKKFIVSEKNAFRLTRYGTKNLVLWSELIRTYIESYWIAAMVLINMKQKRVKEKEALRMMKTEGEKLYKLRIIKHIDSISHVTFKNAIAYIKENISYEKLHDFSQLLYSFLQGLPSL